nr:protein kinase superfamily protein [Tanacetum cinerariifolium]
MGQFRRFSSVHGKRPSAGYDKLRKESLESEFRDAHTSRSKRLSMYYSFGRFLALYRAAFISYEVFKLTVGQFFIHDLNERAAKTRVKAREAVPTTLSSRRKERSLSSLVVSTPRVSTQTNMTGKRSRLASRKKSCGSTFFVEKVSRKSKAPWNMVKKVRVHMRLQIGSITCEDVFLLTMCMLLTLHGRETFSCPLLLSVWRIRCSWLRSIQLLLCSNNLFLIANLSVIKKQLSYGLVVVDSGQNMGGNTCLSESNVTLLRAS